MLNENVEIFVIFVLILMFFQLGQISKNMHNLFRHIFHEKKNITKKWDFKK